MFSRLLAVPDFITKSKSQEIRNHKKNRKKYCQPLCRQMHSALSTFQQSQKYRSYLNPMGKFGNTYETRNYTLKRHCFPRVLAKTNTARSIFFNFVFQTAHCRPRVILSSGSALLKEAQCAQHCFISFSYIDSKDIIFVFFFFFETFLQRWK